jgi:LPS export ABC transporter protein LptC
VVPQTKIAVIVLLLLCGMIVACSNGKKGIATVSVDAEVLPTIHGEEISSLISDSGVTRYRLETEQWDIFSNDTNPHWYFPKGIYVEKFDSLFQVDGSIKADTAYFFEKTELWQLIGNVSIRNLNGLRFETSELFWKQKEPAWSLNAIYSDSIVKIHTPSGVSVSQGIRANQSMSKYHIYKQSYEAYNSE